MLPKSISGSVVSVFPHHTHLDLGLMARRVGGSDPEGQLLSCGEKSLHLSKDWLGKAGQWLLLAQGFSGSYSRPDGPSSSVRPYFFS